MKLRTVWENVRSPQKLLRGAAYATIVIAVCWVAYRWMNPAIDVQAIESDINRARQSLANTPQPKNLLHVLAAR